MSATHETEQLPTAVACAAPDTLVVLQDEDRPQHDAWLNQQHVGVIFDESAANLARGGFVAWSPKAGTRNGIVGFYATKDEAAAAIHNLYRPVGPRGTTEPGNRADRYNYLALPADRQAQVAAYAVHLYNEGGRTVARCWKEALSADLMHHWNIPDEDTFRTCVAVNGGEIHTAAPTDNDQLVWPLCRTMSQNGRRTTYHFVDAEDITCRSCTTYRERRAAARASQAARA